MTLYEERALIDRLRESFLAQNEAEPEPRWCDNCGVDLPHDGSTSAYQIPGMRECYCEACFPEAAKYFCRVEGSF